MRILWIQQFFGTPAGWGSQRQYEFARRWVAAGHAVDVICSSAYDPSLPKSGGVVEGIRLLVSGAVYRPQMGFSRRCLSFLRFMLEALWLVTRRGKDYDILIASSGPLTNLIPALWGRLLYRLPYVFEVLDVWPDAAVEAGVLRSRLLIWCSQRLEAAGYRWASHIVTCSTGMSERVERKLTLGGRRSTVGGEGEGVSKGECAKERGTPKVVTIAHGGDRVQPDRTACRRCLLVGQGWPENTCVVLYMGAMGLSNAVEDVVEAMRLTAGEANVAWVFAGGGACEGLVRKELAGTRSAFMGKVAHSRMRELCAAADINVVTFMHSPIFFENSPNKFFDGIAAGLPAVFNRSTWLEPWLKEYDCGVICEGQEPGKKMAEAIRKLVDNPERRQTMGRNARRLAEEVFDRDKLAAEYLEILGGIACAERWEDKRGLSSQDMK